MPTKGTKPTRAQEVIQLGKRCAVSITGMGEDACDVNTFRQAMDAIQAALKIGKERSDELNRLRSILCGSDPAIRVHSRLVRQTGTASKEGKDG